MKHITKWIVLALALFAGPSAKSQITMIGNVSCALVNEFSLNIKVDEILNNRSIGTISGPLSLEVWLTKFEYSGETIVQADASVKGNSDRRGGSRLAFLELPQLGGGYYFQKIDQNISYRFFPPTPFEIMGTVERDPKAYRGLWYVTIVLLESGVLLDYINFGTYVYDLLPPEITSSNVKKGETGKELNFQVKVNADGDYPVTFSATNLPPGLSVNSSTGKITGIPGSSGFFDAIITATNLAGSTNAAIRFDIQENGIPNISIWDASETGDFDTVKQHLANGVNVNARNELELTPLHYAAAEGQKKIAELLITSGASVNADSMKGWIPLHLAAWKGHIDIVELLIANGADVNAKGGGVGWTPLKIAIVMKNKETADLLRKHGAKTAEELKTKGK